MLKKIAKMQHIWPSGGAPGEHTFYKADAKSYLTFGDVGAVVQSVEYRTRKQEVADSTHTRSTANNLEQVANLLCAQANSASYPQRDVK